MTAGERGHPRSGWRNRDRHDTVAVWLRETTVARSDGMRVELTDRNAWFTGVTEWRRPDVGR